MAASVGVADVGPAAAAGGSIAGTVTDAGPDLVFVYALDADTRDVVSVAGIDAEGDYLISGIPDGDYLVFFGASHQYYGASTRSDEVWQDSHDAATATPVTVASAAVTGIDADLEAASTITGKVTTTGGANVPGADVLVTASADTPSQQASWYVVTNSSGNFSVPGVDVGTYTVEVDWNGDGATDVTTAELPVGPGASVSTGTLVVNVPNTVPSASPSMSATAGVGRAHVRYGFPLSEGSSPIEFVWVSVWPWVVDIDFDNDLLGATAIGVANGVPNRVTVRWENSFGTGVGRVVDPTPTGCQYLWFTDVPATAQFCDEIRWLVYQQISEGYDDATFRPTAGVTRQAMAAFLYRFAGSPNGEDPQCTTAQFIDVPSTHPFCGEIKWLVDEGITDGYDDGRFRGSSAVSRQAMAAFLYRFAGSPNGLDPQCTTAQFSDVPVDQAFCGEIKWLVDEGITDGYDDGRFRPGTRVSRQAMSAFLQRFDAGLGPAALGAAQAAGGSSASPSAEAPDLAWSDPRPPRQPVRFRLPVG